MQRAQASVEYLLLVSAILVGSCLLVRFQTPVQAVATAVVHAISGRERRAPGQLGRHHPHRSPTRHPHPCLCRYGDPLNSAPAEPIHAWE